MISELNMQWNPTSLFLFVLGRHTGGAEETGDWYGRGSAKTAFETGKTDAQGDGRQGGRS